MNTKTRNKISNEIRDPDYNRWSKNISYLAKLEGLSSKEYKSLYNIPEYVGPRKLGKPKGSNIPIEEKVEYEFPVSEAILNEIDNNLKTLLGKSYKKLLFN